MNRKLNTLGSYITIIRQPEADDNFLVSCSSLPGQFMNSSTNDDRHTNSQTQHTYIKGKCVLSVYQSYLLLKHFFLLRRMSAHNVNK